MEQFFEGTRLFSILNNSKPYQKSHRSTFASIIGISILQENCASVILGCNQLPLLHCKHEHFRVAMLISFLFAMQEMWF